MKMASQRFCLRWNNHQSNLLSVFDQLLHAETFTDVTLAVDGQYLKAHKMVLSACSPYFNALFINHPEKHPIVILKDVPYSDMKSLLDFMYRGEVSVDQERLTAFLRVAESLRIKGLTEVNDDKPAGATPTPPPPPPPQLQRIQPYLVQQQQQRSKSQSLLINNNNNNSNNNNSSSAAAALAQTQQQLQQQQHQSLLSSALASMPKRKRGRPRKLSGSSNGTGNDYDDYDRDGMMNDTELGEGKLGNDSFSGNDDGSEDNQRELCDNEQDLNESRDSVTQPKKAKQSKESKPQLQNDNDNSTSVQLINTTPELSQRLFGSLKVSTTGATTSTTTTLASIAQKQQQQTKGINDMPTETNSSQHLPTALGLKIRLNAKIQQQQQSSNGAGANSLLKQQLRSGLKDLELTAISSSGNTNNNNCDQQQQHAYDEHSNNDSCSALQSLANAAERQANAVNIIKPPTANNLHHQFLMHMAANPMLKAAAAAGNDFFQQQQQQAQQHHQEHELLNSTAAVECLLDQHEGADVLDLPTMTDDTAIGYCESPERNSVANDANSPVGTATNHTSGRTPRTVQRRRIRRKAQSTLDDQAEHLTEMSVRGLDLFRYASITEGVYQCTECAKENVQKTFKNKYSFQRHAFLYHEGKHRKVFPCPVCGKEFSRPDKMKNHMKMTHESFVSKQDLNTFHPLNYLISAAAAGEIHSTLFSTPAHQQQQQQLQQQFQQQQHEQEHEQDIAEMTQELHEDLSTVNLGGINLTTPADALLKLHNELIIKNECFSPTPSPPTTVATSSVTNNAVVMTSQPPTQRLEEVK